VDKFERVFDRDDVAGPLLVNNVDHRGERRGLTGTGRTRDENQAEAVLAKLAENRGQTQLFDGHDAKRNDTHHDRPGRALHVDVRTDTALPFDFEREVHFEGLFKLLYLPLGHDLADHAPRVIGVDDREVAGNRLKDAVLTHGRLGEGFDSHVRRALIVSDLDELLERYRIDIDHSFGALP